MQLLRACRARPSLTNTLSRAPPAARSWREALWFLQRLAVLAATSLPGAFVFATPAGAQLFAFGMASLVIEACMRRVSVRLPACVCERERESWKSCWLLAVLG